MPKMKTRWVNLKERTKELVCKTCNNRFLRVIEEPVRRKNRTRTAHDFRVIAMCPICSGEHRVKLGSSHK